MSSNSSSPYLWDQILEPFIDNSEYFIEIDVLTLKFDHVDFYGFVESKILKLVKICEKKNKSDADPRNMNPNKLECNVIIRPNLTKINLKPFGIYDKRTTLVFGVKLEPIDSKMKQPSPQKVQIKQFVCRVIKAFHKELITYHMDSYKNVYPNNAFIKMQCIEKAQLKYMMPIHNDMIPKTIKNEKQNKHNNWRKRKRGNMTLICNQESSHWKNNKQKFLEDQ